MQYFDHEKLDVYKVAIEWVILSEKIAQQLPRGRAYLVDQLQRAGTSIPFQERRQLLLRLVAMLTKLARKNTDKP